MGITLEVVRRLNRDLETLGEGWEASLDGGIMKCEDQNYIRIHFDATKEKPYMASAVVTKVERASGFMDSIGGYAEAQTPLEALEAVKEAIRVRAQSLLEEFESFGTIGK